MSQNADSITYKNVLSWRGCEKLYLDSRTSDVLFIFRSESDECVKLPAHKNILSAVSPVFDAMFYGPSKQEGDINIVDASFEAFKEFLQFFYRSLVKLTADNVAEVLNLGKQYLLNDCIQACTDFYESTLTLDNMCWGLELAILFELEGLKEFCEQQISKNSTEIFRSSSFLNCESNLLGHILQINSLECDEVVVFDGCMTWSRVACITKGLDEENVENLRSQLGDLFYEIRFGDMSHKNFHNRFQLYDGLFSLDEFKDITMMITCKEFQSDKFNRNSRISSGITSGMSSGENDNFSEEIICNNTSPAGAYYRGKMGIKSNLFGFDTEFSSSSLLNLMKFSFRLSNYMKEDVTVNIKISHYIGNIKQLISSTRVAGKHSGDTIVQLPSPVVIKPGIKYSIECLIPISNISMFGYIDSKVQMDNGIIISFSHVSFLTRLHFNRWKQQLYTKTHKNPQIKGGFSKP